MLKNEKESKGSRIEYEWNDDRKIHQSLSHINLKLLIDWIYLFLFSICIAMLLSIQRFVVIKRPLTHNFTNTRIRCYLLFIFLQVLLYELLVVLLVTFYKKSFKNLI